MICPRNAESEIDEGLVGVIILAPTFLRVDVAAGKVARREVKRVSSPNCVHTSFTFTLLFHAKTTTSSPFTSKNA